MRGEAGLPASAEITARFLRCDGGTTVLGLSGTLLIGTYRLSLEFGRSAPPSIREGGGPRQVALDDPLVTVTSSERASRGRWVAVQLRGGDVALGDAVLLGRCAPGTTTTVTVPIRLLSVTRSVVVADACTRRRSAVSVDSRTTTLPIDVMVLTDRSPVAVIRPGSAAGRATARLVGALTMTDEHSARGPGGNPRVAVRPIAGDGTFLGPRQDLGRCSSIGT